MMQSKTILILALAVSSLGMQSANAQVQVDPDLPAYERISGVSGSLTSVGSDTLNNLMTLWSEDFRALYPNVVFSIEGKGSSTAPPAMIEGTAQLGPMSREMKSTEIDKFEEVYGYKPTAIPVAIDALAVFVNKDNPIKSMTLRQVDGIFSSTLKRGGTAMDNWGQLGLSGDWTNRAVSVYGRNSASGTYGFFKKVSLLQGDFRETVKEQPGSSAVVQGVESDLYGVGYSGIGYKTSGVRALPIEDEDGPYEPTAANCVSGDYPLARFLYIYVNKKPNQPIDQLTEEFLLYILSEQGQKVVVKDGYYPLPAEFVFEILDESF